MKKQNLNSNTIRPAEKNIGKNLCVYAAGMCAGIAIAMIAMLFFLRYHLIQTYSCGNLSFDEVEKAVTTAIPHSSGWTVTPEACASLMSSEGLHITNWKLCQRVYATMLLDSEHGTKLGALLPCTFSISETRDGHLTISRLNTTLLGFILGGDAGKIYRQNITNEQEAFIEAIRHINFKENVSASTKKEEET